MSNFIREIAPDIEPALQLIEWDHEEEARRAVTAYQIFPNHPQVAALLISTGSTQYIPCSGAVVDGSDPQSMRAGALIGVLRAVAVSAGMPLPTKYEESCIRERTEYIVRNKDAFEANLPQVLGNLHGTVSRPVAAPGERVDEFPRVVAFINAMGASMDGSRSVHGRHELPKREAREIVYRVVDATPQLREAGSLLQVSDRQLRSAASIADYVWRNRDVFEVSLPQIMELNGQGALVRPSWLPDTGDAAIADAPEQTYDFPFVARLIDAIRADALPIADAVNLLRYLAEVSGTEPPDEMQLLIAWIRERRETIELHLPGVDARDDQGRSVRAPWDLE
ncbi:MAG: calcium-binding protein [Holosporales bacterium]|jgi:hypothetical protein|nr:calcium-binding protein [Holosporales bacterium]